jgi:hypothetical protein
LPTIPFRDTSAPVALRTGVASLTGGSLSSSASTSTTVVDRFDRAPALTTAGFIRMPRSATSGASILAAPCTALGLVNAPTTWTHSPSAPSSSSPLSSSPPLTPLALGTDSLTDTAPSSSTLVVGLSTPYVLLARALRLSRRWRMTLFSKKASRLLRCVYVGSQCELKQQDDTSLLCIL